VTSIRGTFTFIGSWNVIDLRHPIETARAEHPFEQTAEVHRVSLIDQSRTHGADDHLSGFNTTLLETPASDDLVEIVEIVARSGGPSLTHCLAGQPTDAA
jgi:protein tyrosine/serine phosphatase